MGWCVDVCGVVLSIWCIMGGRTVCCIVGVCTVDIREQILSFFVVGKAG